MHMSYKVLFWIMFCAYGFSTFMWYAQSVKTNEATELGFRACDIAEEAIRQRDSLQKIINNRQHE